LQQQQPTILISEKSLLPSLSLSLGFDQQQQHSFHTLAAAADKIRGPLQDWDFLDKDYTGLTLFGKVFDPVLSDVKTARRTGFCQTRDS
jgi:hypothetical protein